MDLEEYRTRYETVKLDREGGVLTMTLHTNGGEALWGIGPSSLHRELGEVFADIVRDEQNRIVVITGTGENFLAHMDRSSFDPAADRAQTWDRLHREGTALLENLLRVPVPMIAAINGPALIHAELPLLCDIVLAAEEAEFADLAHVPGGVVPGDGVQTVWPMLLGPNRGRYFLLTGQRIGAREALSLGLVGEVVDRDLLLARAREHAMRLAALPLPVLRHTRRLLVAHIRKRLDAELSHGLALEAFATLVPQ